MPLYDPFQTGLGLSPKAWRLLKARSTRVEFAADQTLYEEGARGDSFWLIRQGTLEVFKSFFGERHRLGYASRGAFLGEANLFDESPRTASVRAVTSGIAYQVDNQAVREVLDIYPQLAIYVLQAFATRVRNVEQTLVEQVVQRNLELQIQNARLERRVRQRTREFEETHSDLVRMAWSDPLTGCHNRRALEKALEEACAGGAPFAFAMFDVDNFKHYNDTNGHPEGDRALQTLVRLLQRRLRPSDLLARYGGEEFCIILYHVEGLQAAEVCERLRQAVTTYAFPHEEKQPLGDFTVSMGLVSFPGEAKTPAQLIELADKRLYRAKHSGRNRLCSTGEEDSDASL